jgi:hypothetical protein
MNGGAALSKAFCSFFRRTRAFLSNWGVVPGPGAPRGPEVLKVPIHWAFLSRAISQSNARKQEHDGPWAVHGAGSVCGIRLVRRNPPGAPRTNSRGERSGGAVRMTRRGSGWMLGVLRMLLALLASAPAARSEWVYVYSTNEYDGAWAEWSYPVTMVDTGTMWAATGAWLYEGASFWGSKEWRHGQTNQGPWESRGDTWRTTNGVYWSLLRAYGIDLLNQGDGMLQDTIETNYWNGIPRDVYGQGWDHPLKRTVVNWYGSNVYAVVPQARTDWFGAGQYPNMGGTRRQTMAVWGFGSNRGDVVSTSSQTWSWAVNLRTLITEVTCISSNDETGSNFWRSTESTETARLPESIVHNVHVTYNIKLKMTNGGGW